MKTPHFAIAAKLSISLAIISFLAFKLDSGISMKLIREISVDSLGACQGISFQNGKALLYGDREVGMIRQFSFNNDTLVYDHEECKLTINGQDVINHPTGIAYHGDMPVFMGNSVKPAPGETKWKAMIYLIDWNGLWKTGTLDGNLLNTIEDDACIQGTRPEYVQYNNKWYVATADYGDHGNEVRLYDPEKLSKCKKTSEPGVLYKKFVCTPWVQNLYWMNNKAILVLIQNQVEGRKWRFTYVDMAKSLEKGTQQVIKTVDINERADELEGFAFTGKDNQGVAVTSSKSKNVNYLKISW